MDDEGRVLLSRALQELISYDLEHHLTLTGLVDKEWRPFGLIVDICNYLELDWKRLGEEVDSD